MNFYTFGKNTVKLFLAPFYRIKAEGTEHIPKEGGVLLCANHISNFDPLATGTTFPRDIHFMAKQELFQVPVLRGILPKINVFPVKRGLSDREALRKGLSILKEGKVMGLFPEGHRSKDGQVGEGLSGAGFFAIRSQAAVVPCAIIGSYKIFKTVKVVYGKPIEFEELRKQKVSADTATKVIMDEIRKLHNQHK